MSDAPAGWKLVPQIATVAQLSAGQKAWCADPLRKSSTLYAAMVAAAPKPEGRPITRELLEQSGFVTWRDDDDDLETLVKWLHPKGTDLGLRLDEEPNGAWALTLLVGLDRERASSFLSIVTGMEHITKVADALTEGDE